MVNQKNERVFIWKTFGEWKYALEHIFANILTAKIEANARQSDIQDGNDMEAFEKLTGCSCDSLINTEIIDGFRHLYSHVRLYHACRTDNISDYYTKGLLIRNRETQIERFRTIFLNGDFPEITEEKLQESIKKISSCSDGEVCLTIDDRYIIDCAGQYLIYGSEFLITYTIFRTLVIGPKRKALALVEKKIGNKNILSNRERAYYERPRSIG